MKRKEIFSEPAELLGYDGTHLKPSTLEVQAERRVQDILCYTASLKPAWEMRPYLRRIKRNSKMAKLVRGPEAWQHEFDSGDPQVGRTDSYRFSSALQTQAWTHLWAHIQIHNTRTHTPTPTWKYLLCKHEDLSLYLHNPRKTGHN